MMMRGIAVLLLLLLTLTPACRPQGGTEERPLDAPAAGEQEASTERPEGARAGSRQDAATEVLQDAPSDGTQADAAAEPGADPAGDKLPGENILNLASDDYGVRFDAILELVPSRNAGIDADLARALETAPFESSREARTDLEFVRWKRSGEKLEALSDEQRGGTSFILISIDTLRADHLGCYGYSRPTSPTIDALAERGVLFERAFATSSWTLPSHMSIFTSLYPSFHKLDKGGKKGNIRLDESEVTLAEIMKGAGYRTMAVVSHPFLDASWGFDDGFDLYRRYNSAAERLTTITSLWLEWHHFRVRRGLEKPEFFLFLHYLDPHETYTAPVAHQNKFASGYNGPLKPTDKFVTLYAKRDFSNEADFRYAVGLYDAEINYVDTQLDRFFETVRASGWEESTVVILTSDHGEEFKDHGSMGHKGTLYDEQLRIPLIVVYPRAVASGQRIGTPVSHLDILPTVTDIIGLGPSEKTTGRSFLPLMRAGPRAAPESFSEPRELFAELGPLGYKWERRFYRRVIRLGGRKLIYNYGQDGALTKELYDVTHDPGEQRNIYASEMRDAEVGDLEARLTRFIREGSGYNPEFREKNNFDLDEELRDRLRALGYID